MSTWADLDHPLYVGRRSIELDTAVVPDNRLHGMYSII
jgi:hypothetical protein